MLVFASDTHLYPYTWASLPDLRGDSYHSFEQIVDYTIKNKAEALLLGGDIFDDVPTSGAARFFIDCMDKLKAAGIPVAAIQGQHGRSRELSWTSIHDHVLDLDNMDRFMVGPFVIAGIDNRPPEPLKEEIAKKCTPDVNVLMIHQLCKGAVNERDGEQIWDFDPDWVPPTVKLVLMGDYHNIYQTERRHENGTTTKFFYNGSTCMQSISEPPEKYFSVVTVDPVTGSWGFARNRLVTRPFVSLSFQAPVMQHQEDQDKMLAEHMALCAEAVKQDCDQVKNISPNTLVLVRFDPNLTNLEEEMRKCNPSVHFIFRPVQNELQHTDAGLDIRASTLQECVKQIIDPEKEAEFYSFMFALLNSNELRSTITDYRNRIVGAPVEARS